MSKIQFENKIQPFQRNGLNTHDCLRQISDELVFALPAKIDMKPCQDLFVHFLMKKFNCIMIIDDHPIDLYFQTYMIREANVSKDLETVYNYQEALSSLRNPDKPNPDLIFVDISSNRVNGRKFLQGFRELDEGIRSGISLIVLSNEFESEAMQMADQTPEVKRFIHKPLTFEVLNEIVNELL